MPNQFVAINFIQCEPHYRERFEFLFGSRAKAIDKLPGFVHMQVLKPTKEDDRYLVVSHWENEEAFKAWTKSPEFVEGHKRGFEDLAIAKAEGKPSPMQSEFKTYAVIAQ